MFENFPFFPRLVMQLKCACVHVSGMFLNHNLKLYTHHECFVILREMIDSEVFPGKGVQSDQQLANR
jgi:hypothetical protein